MKEIIFIRHAQSEGNKQGLISAPRHSPLTLQGIRQANLAKEWLSCNNFIPEVIYCTNTTRVNETIHNLGLSNFSRIYSSELEEINAGSFNNSTWDRFNNHFPNVNPFYNFKFPDGESYSDLIERSWSFFQKEILKPTQYSRVLIVAHGGSIGAIIHRLLKLPDDKFPIFEIDNASITNVKFTVPIPADPKFKFQCINFKPELLDN